MTHKRPGGLTALAVLNFVFAGLGLLSILALLALLKFMDELAADASAGDRAVFEAFQELGMGPWLLLVLSSLVSCALMIVAGVGYLKQRRWGKVAGNLYAVAAIASSVASAILMPAVLGGGFNIGTMVGLVYPVLTLILLNTVFKHDLGRPA